MNTTILFLCLSFYHTSLPPMASAPPVDRHFSVTLDSVVMIYNNHVGHQWKKYLKIDEQIIEVGKTFSISLRKRSPLRVEVHAIEIDANYSDVGIEILEISYSNVISVEKNCFEKEVIVTENAGQYEGNQALLKFYITIQQEKN